MDRGLGKLDNALCASIVWAFVEVFYWHTLDRTTSAAGYPEDHT